jgi:predicted metal-dependent enzyme (double-stranded beta helix superfamily)
MSAPLLSIEQFIERLNHFATLDFPVREVHRFLKDSSLAPEELRPYSFETIEGYARNLVHKSPEFELLVIVWAPEGASPIHGHEGEKCWSRVEKGELRFTNYRERPDANPFDLEMISQRIGGPGHLDGPADIHKVENLTRDPAVTLHVYSRPYEACDIYDMEQRCKLRRTLLYNSKYGSPVPVDN